MLRLDPLDHDELSAQGARFAQRFQNRDEVAGRSADLVHGLDDVVQVVPGSNTNIRLSP